jgi:toxin CcdB
MAQFDVYRNSRSGGYPLLIDLQADLFAQLETRVVAPLLPRGHHVGPLPTRAIPIVVVKGHEYVVNVPLLAAISKANLGKAIGSLADRRADLIAALDLLLTGS